MSQIFPIEERDVWLALRACDVTSTESSALFHLSPYSTEFELWHRKKNTEIVEIESNERMRWGNRLEAPIAMGVAEDFGVKVEPFKVYMRNDAQMGSSFDFKIVDLATAVGVPEVLRERFRAKGPGILEIKNVDWLQRQLKWTDASADQVAEAPPHIEIQVQHQLHVAKLEWAAIAALVGGNELFVVIRERDHKVGAAIEQRVRHFWSSIAKGKEPAIDWERDAEYVASLQGLGIGPDADMRDDDELLRLAKDYRESSQLRDRAEQTRKMIKAQILQRIGDSKKVLGKGFSVSASRIEGSSYTVERAAYRDFRINWKRNEQ